MADERSSEEIIAAMNAEMDQAVEGAKNIARGCAAMYNQLRAEGIPKEDALTLVQSWITSVTMGSMQQGNDDG